MIKVPLHRPGRPYFRRHVADGQLFVEAVNVEDIDIIFAFQRVRR